MRTWDHLDTDDGTNLRGGGGTGIGCSLHGGNIAPEKHGDIPAADFFPASNVDVRGLERSISRFYSGAEAFAFNHSNSLF